MQVKLALHKYPTRKQGAKQMSYFVEDESGPLLPVIFALQQK
jgi:hypothetical protein